MAMNSSGGVDVNPFLNESFNGLIMAFLCGYQESFVLLCPTT
jgi:hypothetical protein